MDFKALSNLKKWNFPEGKTVILAPFANSLMTPGKNFWILLAKELNKNGFFVCVSQDSNPKVNYEIPDTLAIFFPYAQAIPILNYAGYFIGTRSEFSEILTASDCHLTILDTRTLTEKETTLLNNCSSEKISKFEILIGEEEKQIEIIVSNIKKQGEVQMLKMLDLAAETCKNLHESQNPIYKKCVSKKLREISEQIIFQYQHNVLSQPEQLMIKLTTLGNILQKSKSGEELWSSFISDSSDWHYDISCLVNSSVAKILEEKCFFTPFQAKSILKSSLIFVFRFLNVGDVTIFTSLVNQVSISCQNRIIVLLAKGLEQRVEFKSNQRVTYIFLETNVIYEKLDRIGYILQKAIPGKICSVYKYNAVGKFPKVSSVIGLGHRKSRLGLSLDTKTDSPLCRAVDVNKTFQKFKDLRLEYKKTIAIFPFSRYVDSRHGTNEINSPWMIGLKHLINQAKEKNISIFLNVVGDPKWQKSAEYLVDENVQIFDIPLQQIIVFASLCGYVLTIRSGICELLRYADSKLFIAYPHKQEYHNFNLKSLTETPLPECTIEEVIDLENQSSIDAFLNLPMQYFD